MVFEYRHPKTFSFFRFSCKKTKQSMVFVAFMLEKVAFMLENVAFMLKK